MKIVYVYSVVCLSGLVSFDAATRWFYNMEFKFAHPFLGGEIMDEEYTRLPVHSLVVIGVNVCLMTLTHLLALIAKLVRLVFHKHIILFDSYIFSFTPSV